MPNQIESAAYHEAGHITAAVVQAMPLRETGVHVDLHGHGSADYFEKSLNDVGMTETDIRERKFTMVALYAAHMAQLRFDPGCSQTGWYHDYGKLERFSYQMHPDDVEAQAALQEDMKRRAKALVDQHWPIIQELAKTLLSKPCTPMSEKDVAEWGMGTFKRNMLGTEIVELFSRHNIRAVVVADDVRDYDSTRESPHYDSLA